MIKVIHEHNDPRILVVTPLLPDHKISKITKTTLKRNKTPFFWISSEGNQNIAKNYLQGIEWYEKKFKTVPGKSSYCYMMIDRDIEAGRGLLDKLYRKLILSPPVVGFTYATFQFKGYLNHDFPAMPYDITRLVQSNYISSNSMFKRKTINEVGLVTDDKYVRLLDYAFLLKCYGIGYIGVPEPNAYFIAHSTKDDISARSQQDYMLKYKRVYEDFIKPLIEKA